MRTSANFVVQSLPPQRWKLISAVNTKYLGPRTWGCGTAADGGILVVLVAVKQKTPLHNTCKRDENTQKHTPRLTRSNTSNPRSPHDAPLSQNAGLHSPQIRWIYIQSYNITPGASSSTASRSIIISANEGNQRSSPLPRDGRYISQSRRWYQQFNNQSAQEDEQFYPRMGKQPFISTLPCPYVNRMANGRCDLQYTQLGSAEDRTT